MSPSELRAAMSLAAIFGLRLLGMFIILPVFALWAQGRAGWSLTLAGVAMGIYGLVQATLQIPFGWLSDHRGRKRILYLGLALMAAGSFLAASSDSPWIVIAGRAVLMAMFVVVPIALVNDGLPAAQHWWVYLGAMAAGFVLMLPVIIGRAPARERASFLVAIAIIAVSLALLMLQLDRLAGVVVA